jgi:hypothetical protein
MAWNREHAGVAAAPAVAINWSVTAMTEAAGRLAAPGAWDLPRAAAAVGETVWWVTLVDATLVRYHLRDYERALASKAVRRRKTEETLEGLRYVRNQLGRSVDPAEFVCPAAGGDSTAWAWRPLPEPGLGGLAPRARQWELSRYRAYQGRLAGRDIARTFARCTEFLAQAAGLVGGGAPPGPGTPGLRAGSRPSARSAAASALLIRYSDRRGILCQLLQTATARGCIIGAVSARSVPEPAAPVPGTRDGGPVVEVSLHVQGKYPLSGRATALSEVEDRGTPHHGGRDSTGGAPPGRRRHARLVPHRHVRGPAPARRGQRR